MARPPARTTADAHLRQPRATGGAPAAVQPPACCPNGRCSSPRTASATGPMAGWWSPATRGTRFLRPTSTMPSDVMACWRAMTAPVLLVTADEGYVLQRFGRQPEELRRRMDCFVNGKHHPHRRLRPQRPARPAGKARRAGRVVFQLPGETMTQETLPIDWRGRAHAPRACAAPGSPTLARRTA
jgi:hypothetical protein